MDNEQRILWKNVFITFYGDWIGRPCDNYFCVNSIEEYDHQINISLDDMAVIVDEPVNIQKTGNEYKVVHARKSTISKGNSILRFYEKTSDLFIKCQAVQKTQEITNVVKNVEKSVHNGKLVQPLWKIVWKFLK